MSAPGVTPGDYTYNAATAGQTAKDQARLRVGDTNGKPQWFLSDQEVTGLIANHGFDEACAQYAESIGAICTQLATEVTQRAMKRVYDDRAKRMFELADRIRNLAAPSPGDPPNYGAIGSKTYGPNLRGYDALLGTGKGCYDSNVDPLFEA